MLKLYRVVVYLNDYPMFVPTNKYKYYDRKSKTKENDRFKIRRLS